MLGSQKNQQVIVETNYETIYRVFPSANVYVDFKKRGLSSYQILHYNLLCHGDDAPCDCYSCSHANVYLTIPPHHLLSHSHNSYLHNPPPYHHNLRYHGDDPCECDCILSVSYSCSHAHVFAHILPRQLLSHSPQQLLSTQSSTLPP